MPREFRQTGSPPASPDGAMPRRPNAPQGLRPRAPGKHQRCRRHRYMAGVSVPRHGAVAIGRVSTSSATLRS